MAGRVGGGETAERGLKKGPWTAEEDAILMEYVKNHGEGNWNAVQKSSPLRRCGKSCRLRWANHLRPNLRKGSFTPDEEKIILDLHAELGNKWARMASQLPGRTDNEIKNYWNTRMKRRQRAGLPMYPQATQNGLASFNFQNHDYQNIIYASSNSPSSSSSMSSPLSQKRQCLNYPSITSPPNSAMSYQMFCLSNNHSNHNTSLDFSFPLSSSSSSNDLCSPDHLLDFVSQNSNTNTNIDVMMMNYSSNLMGAEAGRSCFPLGLDIPSNQAPVHSFTYHNETGPLGQPCNSGLLDALLEESRAMSRSGASNRINEKEKRVVGEDAENRSDHLSSSDQSSTGTNPNNNKDGEPTSKKEMIDEDDDLLMTLLSFPPSSALPDWYPAPRTLSDGSDPGGTLIVNH